MTVELTSTQYRLFHCLHITKGVCGMDIEIPVTKFL